MEVGPRSEARDRAEVGAVDGRTGCGDGERSGCRLRGLGGNRGQPRFGIGPQPSAGRRVDRPVETTGPPGGGRLDTRGTILSGDSGGARSRVPMPGRRRRRRYGLGPLERTTSSTGYRACRRARRTSSPAISAYGATREPSPGRSPRAGPCPSTSANRTIAASSSWPASALMPTWSHGTIEPASRDRAACGPPTGWLMSSRSCGRASRIGSRRSRCGSPIRAARKSCAGRPCSSSTCPGTPLGLPFVPVAREDDGWLDLVVFREPGPFQALYYLWKVLCGIHLGDPWSVPSPDPEGGRDRR